MWVGWEGKAPSGKWQLWAQWIWVEEGSGKGARSEAIYIQAKSMIQNQSWIQTLTIAKSQAV